MIELFCVSLTAVLAVVIKLESGIFQTSQQYPYKIVVVTSIETEVIEWCMRLNRRNNALMPVGEYCCEVPDRTGDNQTVCVVVTLNVTETGEKMMQFIATSEL